MNERRKPDTHKPAGDESSSASIEDIGFLAEEHPHSVVHRQLDHNRLPEPQRGHALKDLYYVIVHSMLSVYHILANYVP